VRGAEACAMEVSSHGIEQAGSAGVEFDVALFTNCSREHLDYHKTMRTTRCQGEALPLAQLKHAIVNLDDRFGRSLPGRSIASRVTSSVTGWAGRDRRTSGGSVHARLKLEINHTRVRPN